MSNFDFDLGEYAPEKMLAFGTSSIEEYTNELKKRSINMHRQLLEMFANQLRDSDMLRPVSRPVLTNAIIESIDGIDLGFNTKKYTNRMKSVDLTDWTAAKKQLVKIIVEMFEKVEA